LLEKIPEMRLLRPLPMEVAVLDFGREAELSWILELGLLDGVVLATDSLADERMETLLAEARLRKLLPGVLPGLTIVFFDSAARAALVAVGRLKRDAADSLGIHGISSFLMKSVLSDRVIYAVQERL
jgi:hypothetical protein